MTAMATTVSAALPSGLAIDAWPRVAVDERHGRVHEQHRERYAVWVRAPGAQRVDEQPDAAAVDEPAEHRAGRRDGLGRDEESTEHAGAAEKMKPGRGRAPGVEQIGDRGRHEQAQQERRGYMPANGAGVEQIEA